MGTVDPVFISVPVVVLSPGHKPQAWHGFSGHWQSRSSLLEEAVPGEGVPGESLFVRPEGASLL